MEKEIKIKKCIKYCTILWIEWKKCKKIKRNEMEWSGTGLNWRWKIRIKLEWNNKHEMNKRRMKQNQMDKNQTK